MRRLLLLLCVLSACSRRPPETVGGEGVARLAVEAPPLLAVSPTVRAAYDERCASCHGARGRGDGPMGQGLTPRPRDLSDRLWQSNVSNQHLRRVILGGGPAVGKSLAMPAQSQYVRDLGMIDGLVMLVRSFCE